jgi:Lipopolysaccharide assembly protein A domain
MAEPSSDRPAAAGPERGDGPQEARNDGLRLSGGAIATGAGGGTLVAFMAQNRDDVRVDFLFWHFTTWVWLLVLASAILGAAVWIGLGVVRRHRRRVNRRAARRGEAAPYG